MNTTMTLVLSLALGAPALKPREPEQKGPGYLGITFQAVSEGLVVTDVKKDGPAEKADLRRGDVIIKVNNHEMVNVETGELQKVVGDLKPGTVIPIVLLRDDKEMTIKVKLGVRPADFQPTLPRDIDIPIPPRP